jgi:hypothetical protein
MKISAPDMPPLPLQNENILIPKQSKTQSSKVKKKENEWFEGEHVDTIKVCAKCGMNKDALKTKGTWARHLHSKHTYYCKQCPFQFTTAATLSEHERTTHPLPKQKQKQKTGKHPRIKKVGKHPKKQYPSKKSNDLPDKCPKCDKLRGDMAKSLLFLLGYCFFGCLPTFLILGCLPVFCFCFCFGNGCVVRSCSDNVAAVVN